MCPGRTFGSVVCPLMERVVSRLRTSRMLVVASAVRRIRVGLQGLSVPPMVITAAIALL